MLFRSGNFSPNHSCHGRHQRRRRLPSSIPTKWKRSGTARAWSNQATKVGRDRGSPAQPVVVGSEARTGAPGGRRGTELVQELEESCGASRPWLAGARGGRHDAELIQEVEAAGARRGARTGARDGRHAAELLHEAAAARSSYRSSRRLKRSSYRPVLVMPWSGPNSIVI